MEFAHLEFACRIVSAETWYFNLVHEWSQKKTMLLTSMHDLTSLVEAYQNKKSFCHPSESRISFVDLVPGIRLGAACESIANGLYATAEIAAQFANRLSKSHLPRSFNQIRKNIEAGKVDKRLTCVVGDLQWYKKIREMRTEWSHYSTIFIANGEKEPQIVCRCLRSKEDRQEFRNQIICTIAEFKDFMQNAIKTLDAFAVYLLECYVLPSFDPLKQITVPLLDPTGSPKLRNTVPPTFEVECTTIREWLGRSGIVI